MTNKNIKRFQMEGVMADNADIIRLREQHINMMYQDMRSQGYVPVLDLDPHVLTTYTGNAYEFTLTIYGVYYGKARSQRIYGVAGNREVPMQ